MPYYSEEDLRDIYDKRDGYCWYCDKKIARKNYGIPGARGAWEVDHIRPVSRGGTDRFSNLAPACISCNRAKGDMRSREFRRTLG